MRTKLVKILVAEDEDGVRRIFQLLLEKKGYSVMTAEDGEAAYRMYERDKPDLLVSDINMPNMNGFELLAKIRERDKSLPAIMVSGYWDYRGRITEDPKVEYMLKPLDYQKLCTRIEDALAV